MGIKEGRLTNLQGRREVEEMTQTGKARSAGCYFWEVAFLSLTSAYGKGKEARKKGRNDGSSKETMKLNEYEVNDTI